MAQRRWGMRTSQTCSSLVRASINNQLNQTGKSTETARRGGGNSHIAFSHSPSPARPSKPSPPLDPRNGLDRIVCRALRSVHDGGETPASGVGRWIASPASPVSSSLLRRRRLAVVRSDGRGPPSAITDLVRMRQTWAPRLRVRASCAGWESCGAGALLPLGRR